MRLSRRAVLPLAALPLLPPAARAALPPRDAERVAEVERYLQGIDTLQARFVQIVPNGEQSSGRLWIERPSRLRMVYDPPKRVELITQDYRLVFVDYRARQLSQLPISQTPLAFLLGERVRLSGDITVTSVEDRLGELVLTLVQTKEPDQGRVEVGFGQSPLELRRWLVRDARGRETAIFLEDVVAGQPIDPATWRFRNPQILGWPRE